MKAALLIIDVQSAICVGDDAAFDIDAVVERINLVIAKARRSGIPIFVIQHEEDEGPFCFQAEGWQVYRKVSIATEDIYLRKKGSDSFHQTDLQSMLETKGIDKLVICGLQSDFCVDSTVRRALALGYPVTLVADGHSTLDNSVLTAKQIIAHHNATLANLGSYGPRVIPINATEIQFDPQ